MNVIPRNNISQKDLPLFDLVKRNERGLRKITERYYENVLLLIERKNWQQLEKLFPNSTRFPNPATILTCDSKDWLVFLRLAKKPGNGYIPFRVMYTLYKVKFSHERVMNVLKSEDAAYKQPFREFFAKELLVCTLDAGGLVHVLEFPTAHTYSKWSLPFINSQLRFWDYDIVDSHFEKPDNSRRPYSLRCLIGFFKCGNWKSMLSWCRTSNRTYHLNILDQRQNSVIVAVPCKRSKTFNFVFTGEKIKCRFENVQALFKGEQWSLLSEFKDQKVPAGFRTVLTATAWGQVVAVCVGPKITQTVQNDGYESTDSDVLIIEQPKPPLIVIEDSDDDATTQPIKETVLPLPGCSYTGDKVKVCYHVKSLSVGQKWTFLSNDTSSRIIIASTELKPVCVTQNALDDSLVLPLEKSASLTTSVPDPDCSYTGEKIKVCYHDVRQLRVGNKWTLVGADSKTTAMLPIITSEAANCVAPNSPPVVNKKVIEKTHQKAPIVIASCVAPRTPLVNKEPIEKTPIVVSNSVASKILPLVNKKAIEKTPIVVANSVAPKYSPLVNKITIEKAPQKAPIVVANYVAPNVSPLANKPIEKTPRTAPIVHATRELEQPKSNKSKTVTKVPTVEKTQEVGFNQNCAKTDDDNTERQDVSKMLKELMDSVEQYINQEEDDLLNMEFDYEESLSTNSDSGLRVLTDLLASENDKTIGATSTNYLENNPSSRVNDHNSKRNEFSSPPRKRKRYHTDEAENEEPCKQQCITDLRQWLNMSRQNNNEKNNIPCESAYSRAQNYIEHCNETRSVGLEYQKLSDNPEPSTSATLNNNIPKYQAPLSEILSSFVRSNESSNTQLQVVPSSSAFTPNPMFFSGNGYVQPVFGQPAVFSGTGVLFNRLQTRGGLTQGATLTSGGTLRNSDSDNVLRPLVWPPVIGSCPAEYAFSSRTTQRRK